MHQGDKGAVEGNAVQQGCGDAAHVACDAATQAGSTAGNAAQQAGAAAGHAVQRSVRDIDIDADVDVDIDGLARHTFSPCRCLAIQSSMHDAAAVAVQGDTLVGPGPALLIPGVVLVRLPRGCVAGRGAGNAPRRQRLRPGGRPGHPGAIWRQGV